jgi:cation transporter-like permease
VKHIDEPKKPERSDLARSAIVIGWIVLILVFVAVTLLSQLYRGGLFADLEFLFLSAFCVWSLVTGIFGFFRRRKEKRSYREERDAGLM